MNRIALLGLVTAVSCSLMVTPPASAKNDRPVLSGAMDICKIVDGGEVTVENGEEKCCAQEVTEYDDGHIDFGADYCVTCAQGTDVCYISDGATRHLTQTEIKKLLKHKPKQAPVTGN
jgi:hypothetical protein